MSDADVPPPSLRRPLNARALACAARRVQLHAEWYSRPAAIVVADLLRLDDLLFHHARWRPATTMPHNPHCYTLRRTWERDEDFVWVVQVIRAIGNHEKFPPNVPGGKFYTVLHRDQGTSFWTMGWPINYSNGHPCTILINRKPQHLPTDRRW